MHPHHTGLAGVDIERLQAGYLFHEGLRIWVGRFHNLLGYWNTAYHHGLLLHASIDRPEFMKWEHDGGLLPVHLNGAWAEGRLGVGPARLSYGLMAGNGMRIGPGGPQPGNVGDADNNRALSANLTARPAGMPFTGIGVSGAKEKVFESNSAGAFVTITQQTILGGHLFHVEPPFEIVAEFYDIQDREVTTPALKGVKRTRAWFAQAGYQLMDRVTPYARYERVEAAESSTYVIALRRNPAPANFMQGVPSSAAQDHWRIVGGLRYSLSVHSAIKIELRHLRVPGLSGRDRYIREAALQWAFSF